MCSWCLLLHCNKKICLFTFVKARHCASFYLRQLTGGSSKSDRLPRPVPLTLPPPAPIAQQPRARSYSCGSTARMVSVRRTAVACLACSLSKHSVCRASRGTLST